MVLQSAQLQQLIVLEHVALLGCRPFTISEQLQVTLDIVAGCRYIDITISES
jgi:hypothetical protein